MGLRAQKSPHSGGHGLWSKVALGRASQAQAAINGVAPEVAGCAAAHGVSGSLVHCDVQVCAGVCFAFVENHPSRDEVAQGAKCFLPLEMGGLLFCKLRSGQLSRCFFDACHF